MSASLQLRPHTPLQFCLSCLGTIACWALWIVLGTALVLQTYVLLANDLPVPGFVLRRIEARLGAENLTVAFGRARFDPSGKIFLENVTLSPRNLAEPILRARGFYVDKSLWSFLSARRFPDEIRIDGASLLLPAMLSPSGAPEALVQDLTATVRFSSGLMYVDQAACKIGKLAVTLRGDYVLEAGPAGATALSLEDITRLYLQWGRDAVLHLPKLDRCERPSVDVVLDGTPGAGNFAHVFMATDGIGATPEFPVELGPSTATTHLSLPWQPTRPMRAVFSARNAKYRDLARAEAIDGLLLAHFSAQTKRPDFAEVVLSLNELAAFEEKSESPVILARWRETGEVDVRAGVPLRGELLENDARVDLGRRAASITTRGRVAPALVDDVLPKRAPKFDPYFKFQDAPWLETTATFADGWKFAGLRSRARTGRMTSRGVGISSVRGIFEIAPNGDFRAYDAHATMGDMRASGTYWMNFKSRDFRFLLGGQLQPTAISGWFRGEWWPNLWKTFQFPTAAPFSDVDVRGNWRRGGETFYFGSTRTQDAVVLGADFERASARVLVRPGLIHAMDIDVQRAGGAQKASGWFARHMSIPDRELRALDYDLRGELDPAILEKLGGATATTLLEPWKFTKPPEVRFRGRTSYAEDGGSAPELHFNGRASGGLSYHGFPLETVEAEGGASGDHVRLDRIEVSVAGGFGRGKAALTGAGDARSLGFDLYLAGADLVRSIRAIREFDAARDNRSPTAEDSILMKRASGGKLEAAISAQGNPANLASFVGSGNLQVRGAELGEVHLFGLLSQMLTTFSLNFSTLKLDMLQGSFQLNDGRAQFDDLRVTGPNSVIEANGHYNYVQQTLDFKAHFKPYEQGRNLITAALGIVVNPLSSIFQLQLTGPISKPNWSVALGSTPAEEPKQAPEPK